MGIYQDIATQLETLEKGAATKSDFYRDYTQDLMEGLDVSILDSEAKTLKVPIIYGSMERAVAKIKETQNLTLPIMSLHIGDAEETTSHRKPNFLVDTFSFFDVNSKQAYRVVSRAPKAVTLTYRLILWAKYTEDMNQIMEHLQLLFQPNLKLSRKNKDSSIASLVDVLDMSSHQVADRQDRVLRKQIFLQIEAYLPNKSYLMSSEGVLTEFNLQSGMGTPGATSFADTSAVGSKK